ncbi:MAG: hypothetical protein K2L01_07825 [Rikenellaceae bacterium]|nr:hypothetical protein [Rikenellaceae bacterium]
MKLRTFFAVVSLSVAALFAVTGCDDASADGVPFNSNVSAFTSGRISRYSPVYLVFTRDIPADKATAKFIEGIMTVKPAVKGTWSTNGTNAIVFTPDEAFDRNTTYKITAEVGDLFETDNKSDRRFTFTVETAPLTLAASLDGIEQHESGDTTFYDVTATVTTSDREKGSLIESLVGVSEGEITEWIHSNDGTRHTLKITDIRGIEKSHNIALSVISDEEGASKGDILEVEIPSAADFSVYNVEYVTDPSEYIEVTFTRTLDPGQDMSGLAWLDGGGEERVVKDGNKLRIYPGERHAAYTCVNLDENIRSARGGKLGDNLSFKVDIRPLLPSVEFVDEGVIVPQSGKTTIPFSAVYLRGVQVRVIRVLERNMGQFLQESDIDGDSEIMRVGRLVALKTVILGQDDDPGLTKRKVYALDLSDIVDPEPGAVYRVELSFDRSLSVYRPCDEEWHTPDDAQIKASDEALFKSEASRFDDYGSYYYRYTDWSGYNYKQSDNPCSESYYIDNGRGIGKNILVTDIGLIAMAGDEGDITVLARNIVDTRPMSGVKIDIRNFQHQSVGTGVTDNKGSAVIKCNGKPFYLIASSGAHRSYLRLTEGSALSLSSFDVSGQAVQRGIKGFIYGDRGVWRPGDTLHLGFMLNDRDGKVPADMPVTMELYTPSGQLYATRTSTGGKMGLYAFDFPTEQEAATGSWSAKASVGGALFEKRLRIETVKPNRLKIDLSFPDGMIMRGKAQSGRLHAEWLQGATARSLDYTVEGTFTSGTTRFKGFDGYVFDDPTKSFSDDKTLIAKGKLNENGDATVTVDLDMGRRAPGMLDASLVTRVFEESGQFSVDGTTVRYSPYNRYVGIQSPQRGRDQLDTGRKYRFPLVSLSPEGKPQAGVDISVRIYKVKWHWWWSSDDSYLAGYTSRSYNQPVLTCNLTTGADGSASLECGFSKEDWGTYLIVATDVASGHSTGILSYFDWPASEGRRSVEGGEEAVMLNIKTDKESYAPGEKIKVTFPSSSESRAIVAIENGTRVLSVSDHTCTAGSTTLEIEATESMQPTAYISLTLLQPHAAGGDMPIRMYGVVPVKVISPDSRLEPVITVADRIEPESDYTVTVSERSGRAMAYTLAIVDEGLLDLTRFVTPDPFDAFNAREALGVRTWDVYRYVTGAYGGRITSMFSIGGDDALGSGPKAIVNRFAPVVEFCGPFVLSSGRQKHTFKMPNYNGRVRVMVVAGDGRAYGNASKSVTVSKPVMVLGTLPRVIGVGEEMSVPATVFATENGVGRVEVSVQCSDGMTVTGPSRQTLSFGKAGDKTVPFRIKVGDKPGKGTIKLTATGGGKSSVYETEIEIRSVATPVTESKTFAIEPGGKLSQKITMPGDAGTCSLTLELSDMAPVDLSRRMQYLIGYPHGCIEQITSKAFPQLYLPKIAELTAEQKSACQQSVSETIRRMRSYQTPDGSLAYWPGSLDGNGWGTVYALHLLTEAAANGYNVPQTLKSSTLGNVRRMAAAWKRTGGYNAASEEQTQAYRLYVLALNGVADKGAMNRLREQQSLTPSSRYLLAMAYMLTGRKDIAAELLNRTTGLRHDYKNDLTFGSPLRDKSIALMAMIAAGRDAEALTLSGEIAGELSSSSWQSTQATAFALMATAKQAERLGQGDGLDLTYSCGREKGTVSTTRHLWSATLVNNGKKTADLEVTNKGKATVMARVTASGTVVGGEVTPSSDGIELSVRYLDLSGREIEPDRMAAGTYFTSVATVKNTSAVAVRNLVLSQIYPSGWEILNTRYLQGGRDDKGLLSYQDIRDDRVYSYIDELPAGKYVAVKIDLCAVYSGRFYLPPATCSAMYDASVSSNTASGSVEVE